MADDDHDTGFDASTPFDTASRVCRMYGRALDAKISVEWMATFLAELKNGYEPVEAARHACREWDC